MFPFIFIRSKKSNNSQICSSSSANYNHWSESRLYSNFTFFIRSFILKSFSRILLYLQIDRNPEYFDEPEKFKPERFLDEQSPFTFLPFSAGPRNCPGNEKTLGVRVRFEPSSTKVFFSFLYAISGQKFAMYELKCIISKILRNFKISLAPDTEFDSLILTAELVLRPANAIKFNLKRRT